VGREEGGRDREKEGLKINRVFSPPLPSFGLLFSFLFFSFGIRKSKD